MIPMLDLHSTVDNVGRIVASVGEAYDSHCSGRLTVVVVDANSAGGPVVLTRYVTQLGQTMQQISFRETPRTGKVHPVTATLVLDSGESKMDDELIYLPLVARGGIGAIEDTEDDVPGDMSEE